MSPYLYLIITLTLSALFSGMEIAFVSSNKLRLEMEKEQSSLTNRVIDLFYRQKASFIATLLVGNNICLVVYGILMGQVLKTLLFEPIGLTNEATILTLQTFLSTAIVLVTGEFLPKTLFKINPNRMLTVFALPMWLFYVVLYPISKLASGLSKAILFVFGLRTTEEESAQTFTRVDLDHLIQSSIENAADDDNVTDEVEMFQNVLDFGQVKVRDCIVPRTEIDAIDIDATLEELQSKFVESGHSKVIVYQGDIDNIVGFIHSLEMFRGLDDWTEKIREIPIVPETMTAQKLFKIFTTQKKSLAVVVDEFGGTSGIVSLEDLVEEIFGEIEDEHDKDDLICKDLGNGEYVLSARMEIDRVNEQFDIELPEDKDYLTIGGLILNRLQSFPKPNDIVKIDGKFEFRIIKVAMTKIELVKLKIK